jgi:tetratricopeptide (TPR) repeat protein
VVKITGLVRRCSALLIILIVCTGTNVAYPSTGRNDLLDRKDLLSLGPDKLEGIYQYKLDKGMKNLSVLSAFLIRNSNVFLQQGEIERASEYAKYAQLLSPDYPPCYTHLGKVYWAQNRFLFFSVIAGWFKSLSATLRNYTFAVSLLTHSLLILLLSFLFTFAVFSFLSLYKYFKLFIHDLNHFISFELPLTLIILWGIFIFTLPLFFHWSIFLVFFYWLLLLFIFHSKKEQLLIIIFSFLLLSSPFIIQLISQSVVTSNSGLFYQLYQVNEESWDRETEQTIANWTVDNPSDIDALFSLALLKKREGKYREAKQYYEKILAIDPDHQKTFCNLGNLLLATGKVDLAIKEYNRCIESFPTSEKGYYNLSRAYLLKYMFTESKNSFNKAKELDAEKVDYYSNIYSENMNRMVMDETIPLGTFWRRALTQTEEKTQFASYMWNRFFRGIPYAYWYNVLLILLLFVCLLFVSHHEIGLSISCEYCGCVVCRKCRRMVYEDNLCSQCATIFKNKGEHSITSGTKKKKIIQIENFQKRSIIIGKVLSILLPGAGHLWIGPILKGSGMLFGFFLVLLTLIHREGIIVNTCLMSHSRSYLQVLILSVLLLALYTYSIVNFNRNLGKIFQFLSLIMVTRKGLQVKK